MTSVPGSSARHGQRLFRRRAADDSLQIAAAGAQNVRHTRTSPMELGRDCLQTRSRGAEQPDRAGLHAIGEAERGAVDHRRPAVGPEQQPAPLAGQALELELVLEIDVVAVEEDVQIAFERLSGDARRMRTGHRDQRPLGAGELPPCGVEALRDVAPALCRAWPALEQLESALECSVGAVLIGGAHGDHQILGFRSIELLVPQAGLLEHVSIGRRRHGHAGVDDAIELGDGELKLHQHDRIVVLTAAHEAAYDAWALWAHAGCLCTGDL